MKTFKEVYQNPFKNIWGTVMSSNNIMSFQFEGVALNILMDK